MPTIGSTLQEGEKPGVGSLPSVGSKIKGAVKGAAKSVGKSMAQTMGAVEKAVIEIADFSGVDFEQHDAQKPGGGGKGGFSAGLVEQYASNNKIMNSAVDAVKGSVNGVASGEDGFLIHAKLKKTRFEVQFNPNELNFT